MVESSTKQHAGQKRKYKPPSMSHISWNKKDKKRDQKKAGVSGEPEHYEKTNYAELDSPKFTEYYSVSTSLSDT